MPVANYSSYARSRPHILLSRRTERATLVRRPAHRDGAPRLLSQAALLQRPAIAVMSATCRSMFETVARIAEYTGGSFAYLVLAILSWIVTETLAGCATYAMAMYSIPAATGVNDDCRDAGWSGTRPVERPVSTSGPRLISANTRRGVAEVFLPSDASRPCTRVKYVIQSKRTPSALSAYCAVIMAPALLILSRIRQAHAWRQAIAELRDLDDRSLRDIGVSRCDIEQVARYGAPRE